MTQVTQAPSPRPATDAEIDAHPLLDDEQRQLCRSLRDLTGGEVGEGASGHMTLIEFAQVVLRTTGTELEAGYDQRVAVSDLSNFGDAP